MHVEPDDSDMRIAHEFSRDLEHGLDVEAELGALDAGIGFDVGFRRQVGIHSERHRGAMAGRARDFRQRLQFRFALHIKKQDAAMNDLIRPTLYEAFHRIWPVAPAAGLPAPPEDYEAGVPGTVKQDVVGPVCESGDFLAKDRHLPIMRRGELLATFSAGAYGMAMSSNYNSRLRAAEVLVDGTSHRLIRRRETYEDLVRNEISP